MYINKIIIIILNFFFLITLLFKILSLFEGTSVQQFRYIAKFRYVAKLLLRHNCENFAIIAKVFAAPPAC